MEMIFSTTSSYKSLINLVRGRCSGYSIFLFSFLFFISQPNLFSQDYSLDLVGRIWFPSQEWNSGDTTGGSDVWGYTAPDGEEYAIMGVLEGVAVVRASDLEVIGIIPGPQSNDYYYHRDIKTYEHYAYVVNEMVGVNYGLMIIDLQYLPDSLRFVGSYVYPQNVRSHNLSIDTATGYAYIPKQNYSGFRIVSLADPENPEDINEVSTPNIHDVYAMNNIVYVSEGSNSSYSIWDVSDKINPVMMARIDVPNGGYAHNAWPTDDGKYLMTTEETVNKTVKMWDIQDMNNINLVGNYLGENNLAHNTHIMGDFAYISHYTVGVKIVDISDPGSPVEVAAYDTYGLHDDGSFYGCWGAYPFTTNGYVYASDLEGYLTVLYFNQPETEIELTVNHQSGWNLLGLPVDVEDPYHMNVFPDAIEGTLFSFSGGYNLENELDRGNGYWLRFLDSGTTTFYGQALNELTIELMENWNLISGISSSVPAASIQDPDGLIIPGTLYEFTGDYVQAEILEPGKGYWIRSSGPGEIIISE